MFSYPDRKGLTLTEVIVSALIITILAAGLFGAFSGTQHFLNRARHKAQAYSFAIEAMDKLRSNYQYSDSAMAVASGHLEAEIGSILRGELSGLSPALTYNVTEPAANGYKEVTVSVSWNEPAF